MPVLIRGIFSGGGKIKDATAVPSDVMKGKVFYNNDGRQVGISNAVNIKTVTYNCKYGQGSYTSISTGKRLYLVYYSGGDVYSHDYNGTASVGGLYHYTDFFKAILSISINGNAYNFSHTAEDTVPKRLRLQGWSDDLVNIWKNHIFVYPTENNRDLSITITYI